MRNVIVCAVVALVSSTALAQLTVGTMPVAGSYYTQSNNGVSPYTLVDLSHPAPAAGTLTTASVRWAGGCSNAFKLKFLRLTAGHTNYNVFAERGPFNVAESGITTVALSPTVPVQRGDLIAVTQIGPLIGCGGIFLSNTTPPATAMFFNADIPASGTLNGIVFQGTLLNARASSDANILEGVIAGAGSLAGSFGSFFRTGLQILNRDYRTVTGKFVFHPAGRSALPSDPSLPYSLPSFQAFSYNDVIATMGASGLGSLDIVSTSGGRPLVIARVFNDSGAAGTAGFTEDFVATEQALGEDETAYIVMPTNLTNFRMNIGVRTFDAGATIDISAANAVGSIYVPGFTRAYPPDYFEQPALSQFLNGATPVVNGVVTVTVRSGKAVIYASTTDNRTNDSSIRFAQKE